MQPKSFMKKLESVDWSNLGRSLTFVNLGILMAISPLKGESLSIFLGTEIKFPAKAGEFYQVELSEDLETWSNVGGPIRGSSDAMDRFTKGAETKRSFYRARRISNQWTLVWNDEFEGSTIDRSKWINDVNANGGGNNEFQYYTDESENSRIENGLLIIEARKESYQGLDGSKEYTSARLNTKFRGNWKYGKIEARARMPIGQGLWPAIWMLPAKNIYGSWASSGEIDIVEIVGHEPSTVHGTIHYGGRWPFNTSTGTEFELESGTVEDAFHTYAIEWKEGEISWSVDSYVYQTLTSWSSEGAPFPAPFDQPFYLIVNLAVGGNWPGGPDSTTPFPARMEIDYVRVYQWIE
jgi:beta-glucanase (GH16 family)